MSKVAIVGLGYVGLPVAILSSKNGHDVIGVDLDKQKIKTINDDLSPLKDSYLQQELKKKPFKATSKYPDISKSDVVIVAVPTPVIRDMPDLTILKNTCKSVAENMKKGCLVIIESTINPGVCDDILIPLIEKTSGYKDGKDFYLAHCPERINPGDEWHLKDINRVLGSNSKKGLGKTNKFYESILDSEIKPMDSIKEAEAVKVVENSFRDINIAFVNELAMSFHRMGINLENVIDGAATKPFGYMPFRPGPGVGGHCIPVDPYYLIEYAKNFGFDHDFLHLARKINRGMPDFVIELTEDALNEKEIPLKKAQIALLGLAYKANVDDVRESPSHDIERLLRKSGANVYRYDPHAIDLSDFNSLDSVLDNQIDAVIIATDHDEYDELTPNLLLEKEVYILIDARNMFRGFKNEYIKKGIIYKGIGQS